MCMGTGSDVLEVTEDNIVYEHKHEHLFNFLMEEESVFH